MLLVGDAGYGSRASLNEDFAIAANGLDQPLSFQFDAWVSDTGNGECWSSIAIGGGQNLIAPDSGAKFGILPVLNGSMEVWVNGTLQPLASRSGNSYRIVLSDTAGTGSAFNGNGSKAVLFNGATLVGTYTLPQLAPGDGYLSFGANPYNGSWNITRIDNLNISWVSTTPLIWQGDADSYFNNDFNYLENVWFEWKNYIFNSNVVNGTMTVDETKGWGDLYLDSGLSRDINIGGSGIIHMAPAMVNQWEAPSLGGTITIAADSRDLSISNRMLVAGGLTWNVGAGRTLTATGSLEDWVGVGAVSLEKQGSGTAILAGGISYTGNTTVQSGTLRLGNGTSAANLADTASAIVSPGAMLHLDHTGTDQINALWVDGGQMPPGVYSSTSGFIIGTGTLTVATGPAAADYSTWSGRGIHDLAGGPSDDDDNDGIANVLEYVLGGNPRAASSGILPTATESSGNLVFTFRRQQSTTADTTQVFQHGADLSGWTDVPVVSGGIVVIQPNIPHAGTDTVTITVPEATEPRIFGRLKVSTRPEQP
jgi:autotransporter-associated beta strand protein